MSLRVPHKVFRYSEPKGKQLAKLVYQRCEKNVARYNKSGKGQARLTALRPSPKEPGYLYFDIQGRTPAQEAAWKRAWTKAYGEAEMERQIVKYLPSAALMMYGKTYGWDATVFMTTEGPFDLALDRSDGVPPEILRCLNAAYNDLIED